MKIEFDFDIEGALQDEPFLDRYELEYLFQQTRESIGKALERKLSDVRCDEHGQEPSITVSGRYDGESEQMEIEYHVDTCCQMFMLRVVQALNTVN